MSSQKKSSKALKLQSNSKQPKRRSQKKHSKALNSNNGGLKAALAANLRLRSGSNASKNPKIGKNSNGPILVSEGQPRLTQAYAAHQGGPVDLVKAPLIPMLQFGRSQGEETNFAQKVENEDIIFATSDEEESNRLEGALHSPGMQAAHPDSRNNLIPKIDLKSAIPKINQIISDSSAFGSINKYLGGDQNVGNPRNFLKSAQKSVEANPQNPAILGKNGPLGMKKCLTGLNLGQIKQPTHAFNSEIPQLDIKTSNPLKIPSLTQAHQSTQIEQKRPQTHQKSLKNSSTSHLPDPKRSLDEVLDSEMIYTSERKIRKLYEDDELHAMILTFMISLLIKPTSGILDERYCAQFPIKDGKLNYLHILHYHFNHAANQHVIPLVIKQASDIRPYPAGQRLLKLLCIEMNDFSVYRIGRKIGGGQYGVIFDCEIGFGQKKASRLNLGNRGVGVGGGVLADRRGVDGGSAIKVMSFKDDIYARSVLHDIFSEISCLEYFRLKRSVVTQYDFGVNRNDYFIVMKKFPMSLSIWRKKQRRNGKSFAEMLPVSPICFDFSAFLSNFSEIFGFLRKF